MSAQSPCHIVSAPFIQPQQTISAVMRQIIYALIPGIAVTFYFFGWGIVSNLVIACASALFWEALTLYLRDKPLAHYLADGSAVVTAILLSLAVPPLAPWWLLVIGTFFAIVVAKQLYGGLGYNTLNPAMAGYAVLLISFPREMSAWIAPATLPLADLGLMQTISWVFLQELPHDLQKGNTFDALTAATALDYMRTEIGRGVSFAEVKLSTTVGLMASKGVEWVNVAVLLGGLWLWYKKLISWHIPIAILVSLGILSAAFYLFAPDRFADPVFHWFSGATMLCAFFVATDPVTASTTPLGKLIYGLGIGVIIYIIRTWGGYPDAVAFAVLLMNFTAPLLDQYTVPRAYGSRQRKGGMRSG